MQSCYKINSRLPKTYLFSNSRKFSTCNSIYNNNIKLSNSITTTRPSTFSNQKQRLNFNSLTASNSNLFNKSYSTSSPETTTDNNNHKMAHIERDWWKEVSVYEIYPRSFKDTNGDGIGDLGGIIERLDYLKELGIGSIWIAPIYASPNKDMGYDISDYHGIMPTFGTMDDFDALVKGAHERGIKIVMDLVINHTSNEHAWFKESRASKTNPKADWYIWKAPKNGKEPNNWMSMFGGSAWKLDETRGEYYLHLFANEQPDLNWENPEVRQALHDMVEWWCKKGVDGFRIDAINVISKDIDFPDAPIVNQDEEYQDGGKFFFNRPQFIDWMIELRKNVFSKYDVFTVGETPQVTTKQARHYTHKLEGAFSMLFQFEMMDVDIQDGKPKWFWKQWKLQDIKTITKRWQTELSDVGWNSNYLENHDMPRSVSRFGDDSTEEFRSLSAKMLATYLLTLRGTPFIYNGQELGMTNTRFKSIEEYRDIETFNFYNFEKKKGKLTDEQIWFGIHKKGRDGSRTPIQWDDSANAGFCPKEVEPWIQVNSDYKQINAKKEMEDPNSVFRYYQKLLALRKEHLVLVYGDFHLLMEDDPSVFAFLRATDEGQQLLVIMNFTKNAATYKLQEGDASKFDSKSLNWKLIISNYGGLKCEGINHTKDLELRPFECRVYESVVHQS